ncbi:nascent polypeptide-associated complex subunit beta [Strigomonas culicis]|uniref:Nascent polypeptide-associated complex subunit beta n=1 Tax=Strigomonas culicis TaxID=28005 RepID=S9W7J8_9TRYP|nr:nascent polypeptide-associated complex subunit beta [Strigomonas culicis]|eukprot:EPY35206.1 nascent polypeptide-associated complex subunit beta [Strigomonas culicis]
MPTLDQLKKRAEVVRTGGKGSVRRTTKAHHKSTGDDKKVQGVLRRLGVSPFSDIDEAVLYRADGSTFYFAKPRVQASMQNQCFVVSGDYEVKSAEEVDAEKEVPATA